MCDVLGFSWKHTSRKFQKYSMIVFPKNAEIMICIFSGWSKCPGNECIDCIEVMRQEMRLWPLGTCPRCLMTIRCWGAAELRRSWGRPAAGQVSWFFSHQVSFLSPVSSLSVQCPVRGSDQGQCYYGNIQSNSINQIMNMVFIIRALPSPSWIHALYKSAISKYEE